jgi:hypothetical protein
MGSCHAWSTAHQLPATKTMPKGICQQRVCNRNRRLATTTGDLEHSRAIRSITSAKLLCRAFCPQALQP